MNEQIKLLAKKAGINLTPAQFSGVLEDEVDEFALEDFAKLLVYECVDVIDETHRSQGLNIFIIDKIKQHFGVEE